MSKKIFSRFKQNQSMSTKKTGAAPGTVQHTGKRLVDEMQLTIHDYDEGHAEAIQITDVEDCKPYLESDSKTWLKIEGVHDVEKLKTVWSYFDLHPLMQEDIVNPSQRPKVEQYDQNIFFVFRMLYYNEDEQTIESEQISIVLGDRYVLSFQESERPVFQPILDRLKVEGTRLRKKGPDYLAYALIDTVVDYYFRVLTRLTQEMEITEEQLLDDPTEDTFEMIHSLRRELIYFRKSIWPVRDTLNSVIRDDSRFIKEETKIYLRDVYDHAIQIIDNVENYRDMILGMHDMYMSHISHKMNEVMKVLTIIATIFIPLTFIAGIYGMNFNPDISPLNMPELNWYWGYPAAWAVMVVVTAVMIFYFKRKEWI